MKNIYDKYFIHTTKKHLTTPHKVKQNKTKKLKTKKKLNTINSDLLPNYNLSLSPNISTIRQPWQMVHFDLVDRLDCHQVNQVIMDFYS